METPVEKAMREFSKSIERPLRTNEFLIFKAAWNAALDAATEKIKEPWGHGTEDTVICQQLKTE